MEYRFSNSILVFDKEECVLLDMLMIDFNTFLRFGGAYDANICKGLRRLLTLIKQKIARSHLTPVADTV